MNPIEGAVILLSVGMVCATICWVAVMWVAHKAVKAEEKEK